MIVASVPMPTVVRFRFRSDVARISIAVDRIMPVVRASGCVRGQEIQVGLAFREALNSAVVHGNHIDPDTWVSVRCECDPDKGVSIVVRHEGQGFDPRRVPDPAIREGIQSARGRRLLIMRSYMDEVSFEDGGRQVHLRKNPVTARLLSSRPSRPVPFFTPPAPCEVFSSSFATR
jgi:anti-sigma regulatory factor (Ser/Thr protein kinase)